MTVATSKGLKILILIVVVTVGVFATYLWTVLNWSFSKGERAGYVQKFSRKGWVCKTWEGELQMVPVPGATPEKFLFTVRDDAVAKNLNSTMGRRVTLEYEQHIGIPSSCFGETEYFVTNVRSIE